MRSKKAFYNIFTNLLLQIIIIANGFIVPKIIINNFGSDVNGLIASITQFLGYITLLESGFGPVVKATLYKPIAQKNSEEIASILKASNRFFKNIAYIFCGYISILLVLYPKIVDASFDYWFTASLLLIISISTFAEYYFGMTYKLYLQSEQKSYVISIIQIVTYILGIISIIILVKLNSNVHVIKLCSSIIFILRPIIQNIYVRKKYDINFDKADKNYRIKNKWDGLAQHIAGVIHGNTDITILTFFCTLGEVSVYSIHYLVVKGIKSLIQALSSGIDSSFGDMLAKKETNNLNRRFRMYELLYLNATTICFSCTLLLITPFISLYTVNVTDVNYVRPLFAILLVISEYIYMIRIPYISLTYAAGHFKETRKGAWFECIVNIILSIILVHKYGLIGVTIGTIVAMMIRTIEFMYHSNKYILGDNFLKSLMYLFVVTIETLLIVSIYNYLPTLENTSILHFVINCMISLIVSTVVVLCSSFIFFRRYLKDGISIILEMIKKKIK